MSSTDNNNDDPLDILAQATANSDTNGTSESQEAFNPFDPLADASPKKDDDDNNNKTASTNNGQVDILSQISNWGAENKSEEEEQQQRRPVEEPTTSSSPQDDVDPNVMTTEEDALDLSDDLVSQAHHEFEATQEKLARFEQQQQQRVEQEAQ